MTSKAEMIGAALARAVKQTKAKMTEASRLPAAAMQATWAL